MHWATNHHERSRLNNVFPHIVSVLAVIKVPTCGKIQTKASSQSHLLCHFDHPSWRVNLRDVNSCQWLCCYGRDMCSHHIIDCKHFLRSLFFLGCFCIRDCGSFSQPFSLDSIIHFIQFRSSDILRLLINPSMSSPLLSSLPKFAFVCAGIAS